MRALLRLSIFVAVALGMAVPASAAGLGRAEPWQMNLQQAATPVAHQVAWLHNFLLIIVTAITAFVLLLLLVVMVRFNARANPVPSRTTHNTMIEIAWTLVPMIILIAIAVPSFRLLYYQRNIPVADLTVKVTGNKWYWSYEYPDTGVESFDSSLKQDATGDLRNLAADNPMVVPVNKTVRVIVTASDVIHAWTVPSFGTKIDAVPGRLNEDWFRAEVEGVYYGQCSELCGKDHAFMPVNVHVVSESDFAAWVTKAKTAGMSEAAKLLAVAAVEPVRSAD